MPSSRWLFLFSLSSTLWLSWWRRWRRIIMCRHWTLLLLCHRHLFPPRFPCFSVQGDRYRGNFRLIYLIFYHILCLCRGLDLKSLQLQIHNTDFWRHWRWHRCWRHEQQGQGQSWYDSSSYSDLIFFFLLLFSPIFLWGVIFSQVNYDNKYDDILG